MADDKADTNNDQHPGQVRGAEAGDPCDRCDVAVEGHEADPTEGGNGKARNEVTVSECDELSADARYRAIPSLGGNEDCYRQSRNQTQCADDEERHIPSERISDPRSAGNTEHVC